MGPWAKSTGLALLATGVLLAGAAWGGLASITQASAPPTVAASAPPIAHAVAAGRDSYADIVKVVAPAVVTIRVEGKATMSPTMFQDDDQLPRFFGDQDDQLRRFFGDQFDSPRGSRGPRSFTQRGLGSGVVVSGDGYILTNHHVVNGADTMTVDFADGRTFRAKLVGSDEPSDLAVLKIDATNLQTMALGNSDLSQVGDVVLAVGNPLGVGETVTMGIISAKGRQTGSDRGDRTYQDFIQTDAPINQGNSGGALVNMKGELIGINSQILTPSQGNIGLGFAIPVNMARHVMDDLRKDGRVRRSQLGVTVQPVTSDLAESLGLKEVGGAIVSSVASGSAAEHAGVKRGDVIKSFNGQPVQDINSLRNRVAETAPGSSVTMVIVRDGGERNLTVKLDEAARSRSARREADDASGDKAALGVSLVPLTADMAARAGLQKDARGLVVEDVSPDGRAAKAGIERGDIIQEVNRQPVQTVEELRAAIRRTSDRPALLLVHRGERDLFVTVRPS
jgi:Do/DeqQ family serine protease